MPDCTVILMRRITRWFILALLPMAMANTVFARGPWRASEDNVSGWQLMTPDERIRHQTKIRGFSQYEDCHAYQLEHHRLMEERAREKKLQLGPRQHDICRHLATRNNAP